jgi:hypothetical protein
VFHCIVFFIMQLSPLSITRTSLVLPNWSSIPMKQWLSTFPTLKTLKPPLYFCLCKFDFSSYLTWVKITHFLYFCGWFISLCICLQVLSMLLHVSEFHSFWGLNIPFKYVLYFAYLFILAIPPAFYPSWLILLWILMWKYLFESWLSLFSGIMEVGLLHNRLILSLVFLRKHYFILSPQFTNILTFNILI